MANIQHRVAIVLTAAVLSAITLAHAASDRRAPSPLDDRVRHREGGAISVAPRGLAGLAASDALRAGWEAFSARNGGDWTVFVDERTALPTLVSGPGIPWLSEDASSTTLDDLERIVRRFLGDHAALLGDWSAILELDRAASLPVRDGHWQLVFRQAVDGVRVENARLDVHVVRGRMVLMGTENWGRPTVRGTPTLDAERAGRFLDDYLADDASALNHVSDPQLVLIAVDPDPSDGDPREWSGPRGAGIAHVLVWRFALEERDGAAPWIGEVDAHDGSIVAFYEGTQHGSIRGGGVRDGLDGNCQAGGCEIADFPMPFADYTEAGQPERATDAFGNLTCADPEAPVETNLSGPYVSIADGCGPVAEVGTCAEGIDLGLKFGENCAVAPGASPGNTAAARIAFYHVNRIAELARFYDAGNTWLRSPLTVNVDLSPQCNAEWKSNAIYMYGAAGNCNNTGENTDILVHEWGHGYDEKDGGGRDNPSEAYSDIVAIFTSRDSCMGRGTYNDGSTCNGYGDTCLTCTGFRDFDWSARQSNTPSTVSNFVQTRCPQDTSPFSGPCKREPHCESYISSEAMFDFVTRDLPATGMDQASAWQLAERLWYLTRPGSGGNAYSCLAGLTNSCASTSWYQRMRVADDDDANLANGTPHAAALYAAFARHNLACGAATDATNRSTSSCPALATPVVTRTILPEGVELSWSAVPGAAEYRVYRGELGCNRQQIPIASLPAGQTTYLDDVAKTDLLRYYRVEAFGSNRACTSRVSNCIAAPPGSLLQAVSYRVVDDGDGVPEPGETFSLPVTLFNNGGDPSISAVASLRQVGPSTTRILRPTAAWPTVAPDATAESSAPHFQMVVLDQASCGDVLTFELAGDADNAPPFANEIRISTGDRSRDYPESSIVPIPYVTGAPVQTFFNVTDNRTIADLDITLDIFHQTPSQLVVDLTSPQGTTVRLHDRGPGSGHGIETRFDRDTAPSGPGSMADFVGQSAQGVWTLSVQDVDPSGITTDGYIRPRTLHLTIDGAFGCVPQSCADPKPTAAPVLTMNLVPNGPNLDLALSWTPVAGAGYHVLQSSDPTFATTVELVGTTTTQTAFTIPDGARVEPALTFYQVRAVNTCHQEGP